MEELPPIAQTLRNHETRQKQEIRDYMDEQKDLSKKIRHVLLDWVIEVHAKLTMKQRVLYLC